jgi:hypothetical protein
VLIASGKTVNQEIPRRLPAVAQDRMVYLNRQILDPQFHYIVSFEGRLDEGRQRRFLGRLFPIRTKRSSRMRRRCCKPSYRLWRAAVPETPGSPTAPGFS